MENVPLEPREAQLRDDLARRIRQFDMSADSDTRVRQLAKMRDIAVELHSLLKVRGHEPQHSKQMLENRRCHPDNPDFYLHIHPLQDLLQMTSRCTSDEVQHEALSNTSMIKRLYIDNYRCLVNFELQFQDLTLLLGPNGVGKTSVLDVMYALRQLLSGEAKVTDKAVFPTPTLTRWQNRDKQVFELDVQLDGDEMRYRLEVDHERSTRRARIALERLELKGKPLFIFEMGEVHLFRDDYSAGPIFGADWNESALARVPARHDNTRLTRFLEYTRKVIVCGLYPSSFAAESATEDAVLGREARNFAAWYRHVLLERQELVPEFTNALREVIDGFRGIRMEKVGLDTRALMVMFEQFKERYELRLDEVSDGQRALIALYSLIRLAAGQGYTLLLDEPDNYVALAEIQPWLIELADACGGDVPQAVLCSHHPELIDYLGIDRGIVLSRESSGVTTARSSSTMAEDGGMKLSEVIARGWER
jgi:predicted ATPase